MKKFFILLLLFSSFIALSQPYKLNHYQFLNYGKYLINASNNQIISSLDKNYFSTVSYKGHIILSDSQNVYFIDSLTHNLLKTYTLVTDPTDFIKLVYLQSDTLSRTYAIAQSTFDTVRFYELNDTSLLDTIKFDSINTPINTLYLDTSESILLMANIRNINGSANFSFRLVDIGLDGIKKTDTIIYTTLGEPFIFPAQALALTDDLKKIIIVSSDKTYVFSVNNKHYITKVDKYNYSSNKIALAENNFLFIADERSLYRINLADKASEQLAMPSNVKSIIYTPNANLLISFYGIADTTMGIIYTPLADSMKNVFFDYKPGTHEPQPGSRFSYTYHRPWLDFKWEQDPMNKNKYIFSTAAGFSPDSISWFIDNHYVGSTTANDHQIEHIFFRHGKFKIKAKAFFKEDNDSVVVEHFLKIYYDLFPNIIEQDTIYLCELPDFYIDLTNYSLGCDSLVWYRNYIKYSPLHNQSRAHITRPGLYWFHIYLPDTILSDTVYVYYLDKEYNRDDIKLFINNSPYDPQYNTYCTNDGNIYFNFVLPHTSRCEHGFLVYWYFGDGQTERSSELYTDHRYNEPGIYTVLVNIRNTQSGAAYNYIFTIKVSINPITKYPKAATIQKLEGHRFYVGYDYKIAKQQIYQNNIFYSWYNKQINDSAVVKIPITDKYYQNHQNIGCKFWALISSPIAEGIEIQLFNSHEDYITIMPNQDTTFPHLSFFYGRPKINIPYFPHQEESSYPYFWQDGSSLTFWYMTHSTPSATGIFSIYDYFIEELERLDWYHYQLYPCTLHPYGDIYSLTGKTLGENWKAKFIVHPKDSIDSHVTVEAAGLTFSKYTKPNHYSYNWTGDLSHKIYYDTLVEVLSIYDGKYNLEFSVTDDLGCTYKKNTQIYVLDTLGTILPNVFTPNGDGFNDTWDLRRAFYRQLYEENIPVQVKIWDKYGRVVAFFLANDIKEWNGTDKNGHKLPPDTYWYLITVANKQHYRGYVTILY